MNFIIDFYLINYIIMKVKLVKKEVINNILMYYYLSKSY